MVVSFQVAKKLKCVFREDSLLGRHRFPHRAFQPTPFQMAVNSTILCGLRRRFGVSLNSGKRWSEMRNKWLAAGVVFGKAGKFFLAPHSTSAHEPENAQDKTQKNQPLKTGEV